jgi:hypothetical protein
MNGKTIIVLMLVVAVFIVGGIAFDKYKKAAADTPPPVPSGPVEIPADAVFLDPEFETASGMISAVVNTRNPAQRERVAAAYTGKWIEPTGWYNGITEVNQTDEGTVLRMYFTTTAVLGGGYWVVAVVAGEHDLTTRDYVRFQGRIDKIEVLHEGSLAQINRIVVRDTKLLMVQKGQ